MSKLWLVLSVLLLSACAQVEVVIPNPRVETPETRGDVGRWKFIVAGGDAHVFKATENGGERPPNMDSPSIRGHADVYPGATWSPFSRLEIGGEINVLGTGAGLMAKLQLLGAGTSAAKKGGVPLAFFARAGAAYGSKNGDQTSAFGDGGYNWRGQISAFYSQAGISAGYRVGDHALIYGGVAGAKYSTKSKISQDPTDGGTDPVGGSYERGQDGNGATAALGAMFNWTRVQFWVSGAYSRIDYGPTDDIESAFLHTGVQFTP